MGLQNYKRCANGHYFKSDLTNCPYCGALGENVSGNQETSENNNTVDINNDMDKTQMYGNGQNQVPNADKTEVPPPPPPPQPNVNPDKTQIYNAGSNQNFNPQDTEKTQAFTGNQNGPGINNPPPPQNDFEKTIISRPSTNKPGQQKSPQSSARRRLVGWIVSYELDAYGIAYSIYEGRNKIGRNVKNDITLSDNSVSDIHAILLFRNDKYFLIDQGSSNGSYVNGEEIDFQPAELADGDKIVLGKEKAIFKFKSSF